MEGDRRVQGNGSLLIWEKLKILIDAEIEQKTASCVRMKTMVVTTAYNAETQTIGVTEAFGNEVQLPVCGDVDGAELRVGTSVWVMIPYSMSNAIVMMRGDGHKAATLTAQTIAMSTENTASVYSAVTSKANAYPQEITLAAANWVQTNGVYTQVVNIAGITANTAQTSAVITPPADSTQEDAVVKAKVRATAQGDETITFTCPEPPTVDLLVNVLVIATGSVM